LEEKRTIPTLAHFKGEGMNSCDRSQGVENQTKPRHGGKGRQESSAFNSETKKWGLRESMKLSGKKKPERRSLSFQMGG